MRREHAHEYRRLSSHNHKSDCLAFENTLLSWRETSWDPTAINSEDLAFEMSDVSDDDSSHPGPSTTADDAAANSDNSETDAAAALYSSHEENNSSVLAGQYNGTEDSVDDDAHCQLVPPPRRLQRMDSLDSKQETAFTVRDQRRHESFAREIYLDEDGNVVIGDEATTTDRDDETDIVEVSPDARPTINSSTQGPSLATQLAALGESRMKLDMSEDFSTAVSQSEEVRPLHMPVKKRTKPRKHLSLADQLARLPGAPTGRYLDQSADYTSIIGDDAATFVITRSIMEGPPAVAKSSSNKRSNGRTNTVSDGEVSTVASSLVDNSDDDSAGSCSDTSDHGMGLSVAATEPTDASTELQQQTPVKHQSPQFQSVVVSFLANQGQVSNNHAARVLNDSINLVPECGEIYIFDYEGHIVENLPEWLMVQLQIKSVDSETSRFHLNETKKIMWRLGHSTEDKGRKIQAWVGTVGGLKLTLL